MSVQTEITRIESAKTAIATAIEGKGVAVPEGTKLDGLAALVESIEAGGGDFSIQTGTITFAEMYKPGSTPLVISHSLGKTPFAFIAYNGTHGYRPVRQIAYLYKLAMYQELSTAMRSKYSTIMYSTTAGVDTLASLSEKNTIKLSSDAITISGTNNSVDFNPGASAGYTSTLVWFAIARH